MLALLGRLVQLKELQQTQSVSGVFLRYLIRFNILSLSLSLSLSRRGMELLLLHIQIHLQLILENVIPNRQNLF
jgi:hypothetical protein